jgi:hypothetical protein
MFTDVAMDEGRHMEHGHEPPAAVGLLLAGLPIERRREVERMRALILANLPPGYEEAVIKDMLVYQVPLARYPDTYNGQPLWYVALGSQKRGLALHLMRLYADETHRERLRDACRAAGKRLDMGKACVRFIAADDLPLDVVGELVASTPVDRWIETARAARRRPR